MTELFTETIQRIIPHRYPFLLVDRVTNFVRGERISGVKNFSANEPTLEGQFNPHAVVPAGILIEAVTQLGAILVLERPQMAGKIAVILQVPMARMLRPVEYSETVRLEAKVVRLREKIGELAGEIFVGDELVGEGQMRFALTDAASVAPGLGNR